MKNKIIILLFLVIVSFSLVDVANAKLISSCSDPNYWVSQAEIIVLGRVVDVAIFMPEDPEDPYARFGATAQTKIAVEKYLKGSGPAELKIFSLGDGKEHWVEDQPVFQVGGQGYLFLKKNQNNPDFYYGVCGVGVVNENSSQWASVKSALEGLPIAQGTTDCLPQANFWLSNLRIFEILRWIMCLGVLLSVLSLVLFLINRKKKLGSLWKKIFLIFLAFFILTILTVAMIFFIKGYMNIRAINSYNCNQVDNQITPGDVSVNAGFEYYRLALKSGDKNKYLNSITEESKNMVNFSSTLIQREYQDIKDLVFEIYTETENSAVVKFIPVNPKVPPYFIKKENGQWKVDLKRMGETYIFDQNNNWSYK